MAQHRCPRCPKKSFGTKHGLEVHRRRVHGPNAHSGHKAQRKKAIPQPAETAPQNGLPSGNPGTSAVQQLRTRAAEFRARADEIDEKIAAFVAETKELLA